MANSKDETPAVATFADHEVITPLEPVTQSRRPGGGPA